MRINLIGLLKTSYFLIICTAIPTSLLSGCQSDPSLRIKEAEEVSRAISVMPDSRILAEQWYRQWANEADITVDTPIQEALLTLYVPNGRSLRLPDSPPGYVVQLTLLDIGSNPLQVDGEASIVLVANPHSDTAKALMAWQLSGDSLNSRYRRMIVPGYVLPLQWDQRPEASGEFMMIVRWMDAEGIVRITRNIVFQDDLKHAD